MKGIVYGIFEIALLAMCLRSRKWALIALGLSLPLVRRLPSPPVPLINYENLLLIFTAISFAMHPAPRDARTPPVKFVVPIGVLLLFFTAAFFNTIFTFVPGYSARMWNPYQNIMAFKSLLFCFLLYFIASVGIRSLEDLKDVAKAVVVGIVIEGGYTAAEYILLHPGRATGHMDEPNLMGAYLSGSISLLLGLVLLLPKGYRYKRYLILGTAACVVGLLGTLSRGGYTATLAGFVVITGLVNRKVLAAGLIFLALNGLWLPDKVRQRIEESLTKDDDVSWKYRGENGADNSVLIGLINNELDEEDYSSQNLASPTRLDPSIQSRLIVYEVAFHMMKDYPLGVGFGVFPWYVGYYSEYLKFKSPHNIFLKTSAEAGVPALITLLILIGLFLREAYRLGRTSTDPEMRAFGYGMLAFLVAISVDALSVDTYFMIDVNGQLWLLLGLLVQAPFWIADAESRRGGGAAAPAEPPRPRERALYEYLR